MNIVSRSEQETLKVASNLAKFLRAGDILFLKGNLGTGKTTFTKGVCKGLGIDPFLVKSPTFVFLHEYSGKHKVFHFDLYRIERELQLDELDIDNFFYGPGITVVEWADRVNEKTPADFIEIQFSHADDDQRRIEIKTHGEKYKSLLEKLK